MTPEQALHNEQKTAVESAPVTDDVADSADSVAAKDSPPPEQLADTLTGKEEASEVDEVAAKAASAERLPWDERINLYEEASLVGAEEVESPDELYEELSEVLRIRARQFALILIDANSRDEPAKMHMQELAAIFPAADPAIFPLPPEVVSVQQAHENFLALYGQRIRLLELVSKEFQADITGIDLYGMQELRFELAVILLELRYQILRLPAAGELVARMATRAPLPLIWFFIELLLLIFVFRWWRRWFPETIKRMRTHLLSIRPRTSLVVKRMRGIWYLERIRKPIEWLVFFRIFIGLIEFLDLVFITAISEIVVRWILLSWFAVALLDAFVSRGAGGAASDSGKTRLRSLRMLAAWLVLLGLGLSLAERLAGNGALYALVWRAFEVLAFPVVFVQLGMWRKELFIRANREDRDFMSRKEFDAQRGLKKYIGAAKLLGFLFASWLRKLLLRRLVDLDPGLSGNVNYAGEETSELESIPTEQRSEFLTADVSYTKYARAVRRNLVQRLNSGYGGRVLVIGERGIGKEGFIQHVCEEAEANYIELNCIQGTAADLERQLAEGLGISGPVNDKEAVARAVEEREIRIVAISNLHKLMRPVVGGFAEMQKMADMFHVFPPGITRIMGMDRYAWQYVRCALSERSASVDMIELMAWTEEQITELIAARSEAVSLKIDFNQVRVPSQYLDAGEESQSARNHKGLCAMAASLAGGNPSIASRLFIDCIKQNKKGRLVATLPANRDSRPVEKASLHVLLVLKVIAQAEHITREDIVGNLRYPTSVVDNALRVALEMQWIAEDEGHFSLTWPWFRTITRVLSRQNLLAGVRQAAL